MRIAKHIILLILLTALQTLAAERYVVECNTGLLQASRDSLMAQIGVTEKTGRNDGYSVELYLRSVGLSKGNPYCAAGQYWCFWSASKDLRLPISTIPISRTGSTVSMYNAAKARGHRVATSPAIDDLMFWRKTGTWSGHVERVIVVKSAGWVQTVGFNTSSGDSGSQRDGGGVYKRSRNYKHFLGRMVFRGFIGFTNNQHSNGR